MPEQELPWLAGYEGSAPVRVGNDAVDQLQLDVYGEVMDTLWLARSYDLDPNEDAWRMQRGLMNWLESNWQQPDEGLWEVRGPRQHFTHSKVLAWVAADRAVRTIERSAAWRAPSTATARCATTIHDDVCAKGFDTDRGTFTQYYGSRSLDAALLLIPQVGFLPPTTSACAARCAPSSASSHPTAWSAATTPTRTTSRRPARRRGRLPRVLVLARRRAGPRRAGRRGAAMFERLLALRNDVGLLAEEYDVNAGRQLGNVPQAYSHLALVNSALNLAGVPAPGDDAPAEQRADPEAAG